jgi:hypothetical protein
MNAWKEDSSKMWLTEMLKIDINEFWVEHHATEIVRGGGGGGNCDKNVNSKFMENKKIRKRQKKYIKRDVYGNCSKI